MRDYEAMVEAEEKFYKEEARVHQDAEYMRAKIAYWIAARDWIESMDYEELR